MIKDHTKLLEEFLQYRASSRYRDINGMRKQVKKFFHYLQEMDIEPAELKVKDAQAYQGWLLDRGQANGQPYASGSIQNFIKGALAFYEFLKEKGLVLMNPFKEIKRQRVKNKLPRHILKEKEMARLLEYLSDYDREKDIRKMRTRYRLHVLSELLYSTAMRISEAAAVHEDNIDFSRGIIEIRDIKSGHHRTVFLNEYANQVLKIYVEQMRVEVLEQESNHNLLFGAKANRLIVLLNSELKKATTALDLPVMTSHGFRHAVGYHFLRSGCDIRFIQDVLGHKSISNTEIYTKVDKEALRKVIDDFHPRKWRRK